MTQWQLYSNPQKFEPPGAHRTKGKLGKLTQRRTLRKLGTGVWVARNADRWELYTVDDKMAAELRGRSKRTIPPPDWLVLWYVIYVVAFLSAAGWKPKLVSITGLILFPVLIIVIPIAVSFVELAAGVPQHEVSVFLDEWTQFPAWRILEPAAEP